MTDETCELGKWKLFIRFFERHLIFAGVIIGTACICAIMIVYFSGKGIQEGLKISTQKIISSYEK